jgi:Asp/Glu/hydantoin racemase
MHDNRRLATGGKPLTGARLGILMLEARFPRIPGDMGNATTWPFPVLYRLVKGASPARVVRDRAEGLLDAFKQAAADLVAQGADGIATNCGFLSLFQRELAEHASVPVATSSLMQAQAIQALLPSGKRVGILTIDAAALTPTHLTAANVPDGTPVMGTEGGREFTRAILGNEETLDCALAEADILEAGHALVARDPQVGAVLLECTNMAPYSRSLAQALKRPVFDIYAFTTWFHAGLVPRDFGPPGSATRAWSDR